MRDLLLIALIWLFYGALHSVLASFQVKAWVRRALPRFLPAYRLLYNLLALLLLLPPLWLTHRQAGPLLWIVPDWLSVSALGLAAIGFTWSLRWYDGAGFLGLRQWRAHCGPEDGIATFTLSPLHRYVRHPWYFFALVVLWTRDLNAAWLVATSMITVYFAVGSRLEENKLIACYGEAYRAYRRKGPGLFPLPWRYLGPAQAMALEQQARQISQKSSQSD